MKERPIHYEPHPVTPERKAELVAKGVRIIDAVFAPDEPVYTYSVEIVTADDPKPRRARKAS